MKEHNTNFYSLENIKETLKSCEDFLDGEEVYYHIGALRFAYNEIERLNNIIDELEKWLKDETNFWKQQQEEAIKNGWLEFGGKYNTTIIYENAINKIKELKEGK